MPLHLAMASTLSRAQFHARAQALLAEFHQLKAENEQLKQNVFYSDQIIETRNRLLKSIPPCPMHGDECVPHAQDWVQAALKDAERLDWLNQHYESTTYSDVRSSIDACMAKERRP